MLAIYFFYTDRRILNLKTTFHDVCNRPWVEHLPVCSGNNNLIFGLRKIALVLWEVYTLLFPKSKWYLIIKMSSKKRNLLRNWYCKYESSLFRPSPKNCSGRCNDLCQMLCDVPILSIKYLFLNKKLFVRYFITSVLNFRNRMKRNIFFCNKTYIILKVH